MVVPFLAPVHAVNQNVAAIERRVEAAAADGRITVREGRGIEGATRRVLVKAESLPRRQGAPLVKELEDLERLARSGRLELQADDAVQDLVEARAEAWRRARADRRANPFEDLGRGFRAPFSGVRTKDLTFEGKRAHLVVVDLANPKVKVETNGPRNRGRTVRDQARRHRAELGINGDFFSYGSYRPSGLAKTNGRTWAGTSGQSWEAAIAWRGRNVSVTRRSDRAPDFAANVVSGRPAIVSGGRVISDYHNDPTKALPSRRTGAGVSRDGRLLYLVAVESPISARALGRLLRRHGAWDALSMDSGGSAQLYQRGRGLVQRSSDPGGERRVANTLLIQAG